MVAQPCRSDDEPEQRTEVLDQNHVLRQFLGESLSECAVFAVSPTGRVMSWSAGAEKTFGYAQTEIVGASINVIFSPEDSEAGTVQEVFASALNGERGDDHRWYARKDGSRFRGINSIQPLYDTTDTLIGFSQLVRDITSARVALEQLSSSEERLRSVLESVHDYAIFSITPEGFVTSWNTGAQNLFGYYALEMIGKNVALLYGADDVRNGVPEAELLTARVYGSTTSERILVRKDGSHFLSAGTLRELKSGADADIRGFVHILHDITARAAADQDLRRRARFDDVTHLLNRRTYYEHVERAISSIKRRSSDLFAVLFVDIDHFKRVNDEFGHAVGDRFLALIARRLESCVRSADIVARIGGDEFGILINSIRDVGDAAEAAERIEIEMRKAVAVDGRDIFATVSVGIAVGNARYDGPEEILRDADTAMYAAKASGRARAVLFEEPLTGTIPAPD